MDLKTKVKILVQQAVESYFKEQIQKVESITILLSFQSVSPNNVLKEILPLFHSYHVNLLISKDWTPFIHDHSYKILDEMSLPDLIPIVEKTSLLVIPVASYSLISKLALTIDDDPAVWLAIQYQLNGKPIIMANDHIELSVHQQILAPISVQERLQSYVRQLQTDQVKSVPLSHLYQSAADQLAMCRKKRSVILVKHIEAARRDGINEIVAPSNCQITPAAKDLAKELKIHISTSKGGS